MNIFKDNHIKIIIMFVVLIGLTLIFTQTLLAHGMSAAEKKSILDGGLMKYLWLGSTHMLTGYDHLLFVFGVVFLLKRFLDVVKYVTAFTVGHTITLILATYNGIKFNYFLIDALIALSVCYIAFVNIDGFKKYFNRNAPNLLLTVVVIGLVHGFGLSTRLQELPLRQDNLLMEIISFNVGVELGQILALTVMLILLVTVRKMVMENTIKLVSQFSLFVFGGLLFLSQMHGYVHVSNPDEFGFSKDSHEHAHIEMQKKNKLKINIDRKSRHSHPSL